MSKHPNIKRLEKESLRVFNQVRKFRKLYRKNFPSNLAGMCAIGSVALFKHLVCNLKFKNVKFVAAESGCGFSHCWLKVEDHVIDVTATQFGYKSVVIAKESELPYLERYDDRAEFNTMKKVNAYFKNTSWSSDEQPIGSLTEHYAGRWA